jgi:hypothetical protein
VLLWAKLHLLLFESLAIQDNFLISKLLADARDKQSRRSPFCEWLERCWLKVALREGMYSITHLKEELQGRTMSREYIPFEEFSDGVQLYRSRRFKSYLRQLDDCLSNEGAIVTWNPRELGMRLREIMGKSANDGSSGLPVDRAVAIWNEIDCVTSGGDIPEAVTIPMRRRCRR